MARFPVLATTPHTSLLAEQSRHCEELYLLDFDSACRLLAGSTFENFTIHDYCRYVDDLRLVISVSENTSSEALEEIKDKIVRMLGQLLPSGGNLKFNHDKTKLLRMSGEECDVSSQMGRLQSITSGPMDFDSLIQVENSLDSLFLRAEVALDEGATSEGPVPSSANYFMHELERHPKSFECFCFDRGRTFIQSKKH